MNRRSQFVQFAHFGSCPSPLFKIAHAQTPSQPMVYFGNRSVILRYSEIVHPAAEVFGKLPFPKEMQTGQVSPDKDVDCDYAPAAFTVSPESRALSCCADLPGDSALYAVSVRRLIALRSGFLRTVPRGSALAFGKYLCQCL